MRQAVTTIQERILRGVTVDESGCWVWNKRLHKGTPQMDVDGKREPVRRTAYREWIGVIPADSLVVRTCEEKRCVNPDHARLSDGHDRFKTVCKRGHVRTHASGPCRECKSESDRAAYVRLRESLGDDQFAAVMAKRHRTKHLKREYGMTEDDFIALYQKQNGLCAICRGAMVAEGGKPNSANVDHCHETGRVRGILCGFCNTALGYLKDNAFNAQRARDYLTTSSMPTWSVCTPGPCHPGHQRGTAPSSPVCAGLAEFPLCF